MKGKHIWILLTVSFLDFFSYAAVIPLVPLLILPGPHSILSTSLPSSQRYLFLGFLLATYPLAQILANPLLGFFSDAMSRKKILLLSYLGNAVGYTLFALGVYWGKPLLLFIGNLTAGLTGGNLATTNALIYEKSPSTQAKLKNFSLSHLVIGLAFIFGPYCSQKMLGYSSAPFFLSALIALSSSALIFFLMRTDDHLIATPSYKDILESFKAIFHKHKELRRLFTSVFLFFFGWYFFIKFFQVTLSEHRLLQQENFFQLLSYFGLCSTLTQAAFSLFLYRFFSARRLLSLCIPLLAIAIAAFMFIESPLSIAITVTLFSIAYGLICPSLTTIVSEEGSSDTQGKLMGLYQSTQSLAKASAPALAGLTMATISLRPALISSLCILSTAALLSLPSKEKSLKHTL